MSTRSRRPVHTRWAALSVSVAAVVVLMTSAGSSAAPTNDRATLQVCGARACNTLKTTMSRLSRTILDVRGSTALPPPARPFYVLELSVEGAPRVQRGWYVPSSHTTRWLVPHPSKWTKLRRRGAAFMRRHVPAGPAYRAPRPVRVIVAHRLVIGTAPYTHVFDHFPRAPIPPAGAHWIGVRVLWPAGSPWRFEHAGLSVVPSRRVLARPGGWYRIPLAFARVIASDARR